MKELHKPKLAANMAMVTDAKGNPSASAYITTTELNMLNGIRTNVQNQIDNINVASSVMPDYSNEPTTINTFPYTATEDCIAFFYSLDTGVSYEFTVNGVTIATISTPNIQVPLGAGDVFNVTVKSGTSTSKYILVFPMSVQSN